jgi:hypothetical protein
MVEALQRLESNLRVGFATACAERLFSTDILMESISDQEIADLRSVLNRLWRDVEGDKMSDSEVENSIAKCLVTLDALEKAPVRKSAERTEDAVATICYALRCRQSGDSNEAMWASRRVYEALDNYVISQENIDTNQPDGEQQVLSNPAIQAELRRQQLDLADLLKNKSEAVQLLRNRAVSDSRSMFGQGN